MDAVFQNVEAVLFDLDGTLIDSAPDLSAAANQMRIERNLPALPLEHYRPMAGAGARGMLSVAFSVVPEQAEFAVLREEFFRNYAARLTHSTKVFDGVPKLIARLTALGLPWGVVTNKIERFTEPLMQAMPLFANAGVVISGDTLPYAKPHPAPLLEASRRLGRDPARCIYVGDDERDIVAGRTAGMGTVAASYGYLNTPAEAARWGAQAVIEAPLDLLQLFGAGA